MKITRKLSRRSFLATVGGGSIGGAAALVFLSTEAHAVPRTDTTDRGPHADPRGGPTTAVADHDTSDRPGHGHSADPGGRDPAANDPAGRDPGGGHERMSRHHRRRRHHHAMH